MKDSRYRWVIVAAGGILGCVAIGAMFSLPVLLQAVTRDTGADRRVAAGPEPSIRIRAPLTARRRMEAEGTSRPDTTRADCRCRASLSTSDAAFRWIRRSSTASV